MAQSKTLSPTTLFTQAAHPMLAASPHVSAFLTSPEDDWALHMADADARAAAAGEPTPSSGAALPPPPPSSPAAAARKKLGGVLGRLRDLGASAAAAMSGRPVADADAALASADPEFLAARDYVASLEIHLGDLHRAASRLVRKQADAGAALAEFGGAAAMLGSSEPGPLGAAFSGLAEAADMLARVSAVQAERLVACFEALLKEAARGARAARDAVADRSTAVAAVAAARAAVDAKRVRLTRLRASPGTPEAKLREAEADLLSTQRAVDAARAASDAAAATAAADLPRYQGERAAGLASVLADFAAAQAAAAADAARVWRAYAPKAAAAADGG